MSAEEDESLPALPPPKLLAMEIQYFYAREKELIQSNKANKAQELEALRAEISQRTAVFKLAKGTPYARITDVPPAERKALVMIFNNMSGHCWHKNSGNLFF